MYMGMCRCKYRREEEEKFYLHVPSPNGLIGCRLCVCVHERIGLSALTERTEVSKLGGDDTCVDVAVFCHEHAEGNALLLAGARGASRSPC